MESEMKKQVRFTFITGDAIKLNVSEKTDHIKNQMERIYSRYWTVVSAPEGLVTKFTYSGSYVRINHDNSLLLIGFGTFGNKLG